MMDDLRLALKGYYNQNGGSKHSHTNSHAVTKQRHTFFGRVENVS